MKYSDVYLAFKCRFGENHDHIYTSPNDIISNVISKYGDDDFNYTTYTNANLRYKIYINTNNLDNGVKLFKEYILYSGNEIEYDCVFININNDNKSGINNIITSLFHCNYIDVVFAGFISKCFGIDYSAPLYLNAKNGRNDIDAINKAIDRVYNDCRDSSYLVNEYFDKYKANKIIQEEIEKAKKQSENN